MKKIMKEANKKERIDRRKIGSSVAQREKPVGSKKEKWKADSEAFRAAMRAGKQLQKAMETGKTSVIVVSRMKPTYLGISIF